MAQVKLIINSIKCKSKDFFTKYFEGLNNSDESTSPTHSSIKS